MADPPCCHSFPRIHPLDYLELEALEHSTPGSGSDPEPGGEAPPPAEHMRVSKHSTD